MTFRITSPDTIDYNCIAWAAREDFRWWWPDKAMDYYWPPGIERKSTIENFIKAYETIGFQVCNSEIFEEGFEKIALYVKDGKPQHASRQLTKDVWTSKLGPSFDIIHPFIVSWSDVVIQNIEFESSVYGELAKLLKRPLK